MLAYPKTPGEVHLQNNLLVASRDVKKHQFHCLVAQRREKTRI